MTVLVRLLVATFVGAFAASGAAAAPPVNLAPPPGTIEGATSAISYATVPIGTTSTPVGAAVPSGSVASFQVQGAHYLCAGWGLTPTAPSADASTATCATGFLEGPHDSFTYPAGGSPRQQLAAAAYAVGDQLVELTQ